MHLRLRSVAQRCTLSCAEALQVTIIGCFIYKVLQCLCGLNMYSLPNCYSKGLVMVVCSSLASMQESHCEQTS